MLEKSRMMRWLLGLIIITTLVGLYYLSSYIEFTDISTYAKQSGAFAPVLFIIIYVIAIVAMLPALVLTIFSGALFGPLLGTLLTLTAATLGASLAYLMGRYIVRDWVLRNANTLVQKAIAGVNREGWRFVAFIRLMPIFPFNICNYAFGVTNIKLLPYAVTTFIAASPASFAYCYLGYLGRSATTDDTSEFIGHVLIVISLFAVLLYLPRLIKRFRS